MLQGDDGVSFKCCVTIQRLNSSGLAATSQCIRRASVSLERNEFKEIVLRVHDGKAPRNFTLRDIKLFTRFSKDGKCTVKIIPDNIQILISDCPPDHLATFLKTLSIKHLVWKSSKPLTDRDKFLAGLPRSFATISPLQQKDVQRANNVRNRACDQQLTSRPERTNNAMNERLQVKRPRADHDESMVCLSRFRFGKQSISTN